MLSNKLVVKASPAMAMLSVPICQQPFKAPNPALRTALSDVYLKKKTLGVRLGC